MTPGIVQQFFNKRGRSIRACVISLLAPLVWACSDQSTETWLRHTIDDTYRGADGVDLRDIDQDDDLDAVVGWEESGLVIVYENPGVEMVKYLWPKVDVGGGLDMKKTEDAKFADLDADGQIDAVISATEMHHFKLGIHWINDIYSWRSATAWQGTWIDPQKKYPYLKVAIGQLDNKYGNDIVAGTKEKLVDGINYEGKLIWFASPEILGPESSDLWKGKLMADIGWINHIELMDLDADGDNDVMISDRVDGLRWFENRLSSSAAWIEHVIGPNAGSFAICRNVVTDSEWSVVTHSGNGPVIYSQSRSGEWRQQNLDITNELPNGQPFLLFKGVACGDLNLDGRTDFAVSISGQGHGVYAFVQEKDHWRIVLIAGTDKNNYFKGIKHDTLGLTDLDGDGDLDVVTTDENGGLFANGLGLIWFENPEI